MSHPIPGHDYSEQHREESNSEYRARRAGIPHIKQLNLSTTKKHKKQIAKMLGTKSKALKSKISKVKRARFQNEYNKYFEKHDDMSGKNDQM